MLNGKTAIVTGGSRGIGAAVARKLASLGADIAVIYAGNQEKAEAVCEECRTQYGVRAESFCCNVADFDAVKQTVAAVKQTFGHVEILINNAGINRDGLVAMMPEADFDALMAEYNEDPTMTVGVPVSKLEADSTEYLTTLFDLEENQVSSPIVLSDGVYILKRCPISASYYDENQSDIYQAALDWRFDETLAGWLGDYPVTVSSVVDKIDLNNLRDYIK